MSDKRLLIFDDDSSIAISLRSLSRVSDIEVDNAQSVEEVEAMLKERDYGIAIVDIGRFGHAPGGCGELFRDMNALGSGTCAIIATGNGSPESMRSAYIIGASVYLKKPLSQAEIGAALARLGVYDTLNRPPA